MIIFGFSYLAGVIIERFTYIAIIVTVLVKLECMLTAICITI